MFRKSYLPTILSGLAVAIVLAGLLGNDAQPAAATTLVGSIGPQAAAGIGFTYQGYLTRNGAPINGAGQCDMRFSLWDAASAGAQVGNLQLVGAVDFTNGTFAVTLNDGNQFGADAFSGAARWLQVELACPSGSASFSAVGRQAITSVPYASYSQSTGALQGRPISAAAPTSGQVLRWDGNAWAPANAYARTVLVSPRGTPAQSGAALLASLAATADASASNPYLLKIEPGVYDLGTNTLQMRFYVDIEGSGQSVTILRGERQTDNILGLINTQSNAELRQLSVEVASGAGAFAVGISNNNASPRIVDVTIRTDGATSYGIVNRNGASPRIERVTALAIGATVLASGVATFNSGTPTLVDTALRADAPSIGSSAGLYAEGGANGVPTVTVLGGSIEGSGTIGNTNEFSAVKAFGGATVRLYNVRVKSSYIAFRLGPNGTALVAGSEIDVPFLYGFGQPPLTLKCVGSYTPDLTPLNSGCVP